MDKTVELRSGMSLKVVTTQITDSTFGKSEVEVSKTFTFEEVLEGLGGKAVKRKNKLSTAGGFNRAISHILKASETGKWLNGTDISKEKLIEMLDKQIEKTKEGEFEISEEVLESINQIVKNLKLPAKKYKFSA